MVTKGAVDVVYCSDLCAGGPSIMMLIQRICIAFNGFGSCITVDSVISVRAAILLKLYTYMPCMCDNQSNIHITLCPKKMHQLSKR